MSLLTLREVFLTTVTAAGSALITFFLLRVVVINYVGGRLIKQGVTEAKLRRWGRFIFVSGITLAALTFVLILIGTSLKQGETTVWILVRALAGGLAAFLTYYLGLAKVYFEHE